MKKASISYLKNKLFHFLLAALYLTYTSFTSAAQVGYYPFPEGLKPSSDYRVFINGKEIFVYASPVPAAYCSFEISGTVNIEIKAIRDVKWADVKPMSHKINPIFKDSTIRFSISKPLQLSVELNGKISTPLFIFANEPEKIKPSKTDPNTIYFEGGKVYYPGIIQLKSNQTLYIEGGAVVTGVIKAKDAKNIKIAGHGILDGTYNRNFDNQAIQTGDTSKIIASTNGFYQRFIEFDNCEDITVQGVTLHNSTSWQIVPVNCRRVSIDNIKIVSDNASDDGIDIVHSKNVRVRNSFIRTKDDCVVIKAYMRKTEKPGIDSFLVQGPNIFYKYNTQTVQDVDNVNIEHCVIWNALWGNALEIGFELNGANVQNIHFSNCDIIHVESGAVISIHNAGNSLVQNIIYENIRIEDARQKLIDLAVFRSQYSEDRSYNSDEYKKLYLNGAWDGVLMVPANKVTYHAQFRGKIKNIVFKNISVVDGSFPFSILSGYDSRHNIENVLIENMRVHSKKITRFNEARVYTENAKKIKLL